MRCKSMVAVVVGGGQGIGKEICCKLAAEGADVVVADISDGNEAVAAEIRAMGCRSFAMHTDLRSEESVQALAAAVMDKFGTVHAVVNNSGIVLPAWGVRSLAYIYTNTMPAFSLNNPSLDDKLDCSTVVQKCVKTVDGYEDVHVNLGTGEISYEAASCVDEGLLREAFAQEATGQQQGPNDGHYPGLPPQKAFLALQNGKAGPTALPG
ncbi:hypothetical protein B566_EDAN018520 [Ephemera danica]|nr:hypothetical protein B566_EDAN018520 [Ephemera danica]